jgi:6-phosphogluconolactonase
MRRTVRDLRWGVPLTCLLAACGSSGGSGGTGGAGGMGTGGTDAGASAGSGGATTGTGGAAPSDAGTGGANTDAGALPTNAAVYTMSNAAAGNAIVGFKRAANGSLSPMAAPFVTGGKGSGAGLGEQGALAYDLTNNRLLTVNGGDHSFSVLPVNSDGTLGTALNVTAASAGAVAPMLSGPKSITFHGDLIYVLYQGTATIPSMIAGWKLGTTGGLAATAIAGSALTLSSDTQSVDPAQVEFTPDGKYLVVTEKQSGAAGAVKGAGKIDTFSVDDAGVAKKMGSYDPAPTPVADGGVTLQMTPFGFEFLGQYLIVSEAGSTGVGAYTYAGGVIAPVAASQFQPTDPAPCWVAVTANWAYVANARGPNISGFTVGANGALSNIGAVANAVVASTGRTIPGDGGVTIQGPTDEFFSVDGKYLYVLNAAVPSVGVFKVESNGTLSRVGDTDYTPAMTDALPMGAVGIVAR